MFMTWVSFYEDKREVWRLRSGAEAGLIEHAPLEQFDQGLDDGVFFDDVPRGRGVSEAGRISGVVPVDGAGHGVVTRGGRGTGHGKGQCEGCAGREAGGQKVAQTFAVLGV